MPTHSNVIHKPNVLHGVWKLNDARKGTNSIRTWLSIKDKDSYFNWGILWPEGYSFRRPVIMYAHTGQTFSLLRPRYKNKENGVIE